MITCIIVYEDPEQIENYDLPEDVYTLLDENSKKTRLKAQRLRRHYAARKTPFCIVKENDKVMFAFYREAEADPIKAAQKYIMNLERGRDVYKSYGRK